jgi:hypothetical protein
VYNLITIEQRNKPTVSLSHRDFVSDGRSAAAIKGMPMMRIVSETVPCECSIDEQIDAGVTAVIDDIITALTKPLSEEEKSPKPKDTENLPRVVFKGNLAEVNTFFYKRGWTDGLPVIPPTDEAVREMLAGTDLPPDHVVGKIVSRFGKATVEKIAVNAVMAGALPTYMPLIIAGVEALADSRPNMAWAAVGTGSHAPCWIVNGPVRKGLNINSGSGYLNPGDIANAAIGRALGLVLKNIGGNRKGIEDMGTHGHPGKYTMVFAENEEESPWEPMHVDLGFNKDDSTITLCCPDSYNQFWPYGTSDKGILNSIIYNMIPARWGLYCVALPPVHAMTLAKEGFTKKMVASFISQFAQVPAYQHPSYNGSTKTGTSRGEAPIGRMPLNPTDSVRILFHQDWIRVVVAGGPGNYICAHQGGGGFLADWVTKKAVLPRNWDKLVAKYRNMVPTHIRY